MQRFGQQSPPVQPIDPRSLFVGLSLDWGRQLSGIDLLGVMEAAAQRDGGRDDGKGNKDAHDLIPLLALSLLGTRDFRHLTALRLEKR
jgi:hypothetical protein